MRRWALHVAAIGTGLIAIFAVACGSNNNGNTSSNAAGTNSSAGAAATAAVPISARTSESATPLAAVHGTAAPNAIGAVRGSPSALAAAGAQRITITATDNKFSQTKLTAKANQDIELTLEDKGQATHNWHLLNVTDPDGKEIKTRLLNPGEKETIDFIISKPGTYNFQCDVHPADMKGTLTISQ